MGCLLTATTINAQGSSFEMVSSINRSAEPHNEYLTGQEIYDRIGQDNFDANKDCVEYVLNGGQRISLPQNIITSKSDGELQFMVRTPLRTETASLDKLNNFEYSVRVYENIEMWRWLERQSSLITRIYSSLTNKPSEYTTNKVADIAPHAENECSSVELRNCPSPIVLKKTYIKGLRDPLGVVSEFTDKKYEAKVSRPSSYELNDAFNLSYYVASISNKKGLVIDAAYSNVKLNSYSKTMAVRQKYRSNFVVTLSKLISACNPGGR